MCRVAIIMLFAVCSFVTAGAQTFLERLQRPVKGRGTVTVHQDAAIDALVNGPKSASVTPKTSSTTAMPRTTTTPTARTTAPEAGKAAKNTAQETNGKTETEAGKATAAATGKTSSATSDHSTTTDPEATTSQKKVMRNSYKVTGFRVQAFAGGNSRQDKIKAEQIGERIKAAIPGEPIYVHFYSPRWICRVGNYRTYEEAHQMLQAIKKLGYTQASIVKGKISVQY